MKIRKMESADLTALFGIYKDKEVVNNNRYLPNITQEDFESMFNDSQHNFVAVDSAGKIVGHLSICTTEKARVLHSASFGIAVDKLCRGQGVGRYLMEHLLSYCDEKLDLVRIELEVHSNNAAALRLYKSFGFEVEGIKRKAVLVEDELIDIVIMSRIRT